jgi:hypothetical protein
MQALAYVEVVFVIYMKRKQREKGGKEDRKKKGRPK